MESKPKILVVDDDPQVLEMIMSALTNRENCDVTMAIDADIALGYIKEYTFDTVISDINMPRMDGLSLLERINTIDPKLPVILMTGYADVKMMQTAIKLGVYDFLKKPFSLTELQISTHQAIQKRQLMIQNEKYTKSLEAMVFQKTTELYEANRLLEQNFIRTAMAMINALEANHEYSKGHSERVTNISMLIGHKLRMSIQELKILRTGAVLHDIGKIVVYTSLLNKRDSLSEDEIELIKQHPLVGQNIINPVAMDREICNIIVQHHERIDGSGYPYGLKDRDISIFAKVVAIADAYDAMTSGRAYRDNLTHEQAYNEIKRCAGTQFDSDCTASFLHLATAYDFSALDAMPADSFLTIDK